MPTSAGGLRLVIFVALVFTWPIPLLGLDHSVVPVARFVQLAASLAILIVLEGTGGVVAALFFLLVAHVVVYGLILFTVSSVAMRHLLPRVSERAGLWLTAAALLALVCWASLDAPYGTIFHHSDAHASLMSLYR